MTGKRIRGDYQTPEAFSHTICHYLYHDCGLRPNAVLEPTCGLGHLLQASMIFDAQQYIGIELNPEYCTTCRNTLTDPRVTIHNADIFGFSTKKLFTAAALSGPILILGNPRPPPKAYMALQHSLVRAILIWQLPSSCS